MIQDSRERRCDVDLAAAVNQAAYVALPRSLPTARANHYFAQAAAGQSADQLRALAGDEEYRTRFARERLRDWPFENLTQLIAAGRVRLEQLEGEIADRCAQQRRLVALLSPAATDDERTSPPAPLDDDVGVEPPIAAVIPERTAAASIAKRPTTTQKTKEKRK